MVPFEQPGEQRLFADDAPRAEARFDLAIDDVEARGINDQITRRLGIYVNEVLVPIVDFLERPQQTSQIDLGAPDLPRYQVKRIHPDVAHALLRAVSRLLSTPLAANEDCVDYLFLCHKRHTACPHD